MLELRLRQGCQQQAMVGRRVEWDKLRLLR